MNDSTAHSGRSRTGRITLVLLFACCMQVAVLAQNNQRTETFKGFTLVRQVTEYDAAGRAFPYMTETFYVSSTGDWRYVGAYPNGRVAEAINLCGSGMFIQDHVNDRLVRYSKLGCCRPALKTAGELTADPKFVRTENVLERLAYMHLDDRYGFVEETYFTPAIGPFHLKRISYHDGYKRVEEPLSLTFGEPSVAQLRGEDYPTDEQKPVFDGTLESRIQTKPMPQYPSEAQAVGIDGKVILQVIADESGQVISAHILSSPPMLGEAALDAAYRARFPPLERSGMPVKVTGYLTYEFPQHTVSAPEPVQARIN